MLKWLVVGIGDVTTKRVIPAILAEPRSRLAGIVTRNPTKAAGYVVPIWQDLNAALLSSDADAVYVATPVFLHGSQTITSLRSGRHVLCEKPMAMRYAEACAMQQAAVQAGRKLGVAYYRRMHSHVNRAKELILSGAIGQPFLVEAALHDWIRNDDPSNWRVQPDLSGGGPLYDVGSHRIDLMNFLIGLPVRASGHLSRLVHPILVEDNATVLIEYQNGVRGIVDVRWHSRVPRDEFRIRGTEGEIDLTPLSSAALVHPRGREQFLAPDNPHLPCIAEFVSAVINNSPMRSTGETALITDWVTEQVLANPHSAKNS